MAPSSKFRHRFQNSLDMVAARSVYVDLTQPSGTDNAWSMMDSPTLGRMWSASMLPDSPFERSTLPIPALSVSVAPLRIRKVKPSPTESLSCNSAPVEAKKVDVAPLNVKKMRRRGFSTSLRLVLPPSPLPLPRSPLGKSSFLATPATPLIPPRSPSGLSHTSTPQTALTFTAEWDLTQRTFVFTPFQSSYSPSAISPLHAGSPVPDDVANEIVVVSPAETSVTSPFSPLDSPSVYSATTSSVFSHDRIGSPSTAPSSAADINSKSDVPSASLSRQITLHLFREELQRAIPSDTLKCNFDKGCYEDLDEDLLLAPMDVFSQMLWESTDPEAPVPHEEVVNYSRATFEPKRPLKISINTKSLVERKSPSVERANSSPQRPSPRTRRKRNFSQDMTLGHVALKL